MKNFTLKVLLLCFAASSCTEEKNKIEIYFPKHRIESKEGIPINIAFKRNKYADEELERLKNSGVRYDTLKKEWFFCGSFKASLKDLEQKPIITNDEIIGFNLKKSLIFLSESAMKKISKLEPNPKDKIGHQFIICIDKKPTICGYFINGFSSYWSSTYSITYIYNFDKNKKYKSDKYNYDFRYGKKYRALDSINERELISAFKETNRIIN